MVTIINTATNRQYSHVTCSSVCGSCVGLTDTWLSVCMETEHYNYYLSVTQRLYLGENTWKCIYTAEPLNKLGAAIFCLV